ncbi:MAG: MBOAT family protein [Rhodospirillales bacterium]|nr:MBOAT family protein [Rhodospirillales bacterium]
MLFNSYLFLFAFLPVVAAAFFVVRHRTCRLWLIICASFLFYGMSGVQHATVLGLEVVWVYLIARSPRAVGDPIRLTLSLVPIFLALFYYKYIGFFIADVLMIKETDTAEAFSLFSDVVLPAGISFFTFQLAAFAIDRYRGDVDEPPSFSGFAAYISFFPQLIAGPIVRYNEIRDALADIGSCSWDRERLSRAVGYISFGLALKVLLADTLSDASAHYVAQPGELAPLSALYLVFSYSFQIYFDFYGYSLIAIGLGLIFGFRFPDNFMRPYESLNIRDFWRRWHITLSYWIRDYLYRPLGGNQSYMRNILIVFAVCGLWHGAGWTFIVWGLYHGVLVIMYHACRRLWDRMPVLLQQGLTFTLVSFGWVLFIFDFDGTLQFARALLGGADEVTAPLPTLEMWLYLGISAAVCFFPRLEKIAENVSGASPWLKTAGYASLLVLAILFLDRSQGFIYFRF